MNIGKTIQDLRKKQGLSGVALAKKVGITQTFMSLIEAHNKGVSIATLKKICKELNISLGGLYLLSLTEDDVPQSNKQMFYAFKPTLERIFIDKDEQD